MNQITTSKDMLVFYRNKFNPVTESMEGAALHYVCLMEKTLSCRCGISNYMVKETKKWNMNESIANLNKKLLHLIESLTV